MISLNNFKSELKDAARSNRFLAEIYPSQSIVTTNRLEWIYFVKSISLPERSFGELQHKRLGIARKIAGDPVYNDLTITFLNDINYVLRNLIDDWHENIINQESNVRANTSKYSVGSSIIVKHLDGKGSTISKYRFNDVWPKSISAVELNADSNDQASELSVTFAYNTWSKL